MNAQRRNRSGRARLTLAALVLAGTLAGCGLLDPEDHPAINGTFVATIGGPDTVVFRADRTGEWIRVTDELPTPLGIALRQFTYRSSRRALEVTMHCPPNAGCVEGPHYRARLESGGELVVEPARSESSEPARRFRRHRP